MTIQTRWYDDSQTVIYYEFSDPWTWEELYACFNISLSLMDQVSHKVYIIVDVSHAKAMPRISRKAFQTIANAPTMKHPNATVRYMVGMRPYFSSVLGVFGNLFPKAFAKYQVASSVEMAFEKIRASQQAAVREMQA